MSVSIPGCGRRGREGPCDPVRRFLERVRREPRRRRRPGRRRARRPAGGVRAAGRAAGPLRSGETDVAGRAAPAGLRRRRRLRPLAGNRRAGSRHVFRHPLRAQDLAADFRLRGADRAEPGRHARRGSGLSGRANRGADHADHRPAALVPGDPAGARARRHPRTGEDPADDRAHRRAVRVLRAHGARGGRRRAQQGVHRGRAVGAAAGAHRDLSPYPAELPAAA